MIRNIVFDVGDVLFHYRWKDMFMDYGVSEEEGTRIGRQIFNEPQQRWLQFDKGLLTLEELIDGYAKSYPKDAEIIRFFLNHSEYMPVAHPEAWRFFPKLKEKGYKVYLLSNYSKELFERHTEHADFMEYLDGKIVSYMVKELKPDAAIYQALCDKYSLKPEECIFFDDRKENVEAAIAFGMKAKQVTSRQGLVEDLTELL